MTQKKHQHFVPVLMECLLLTVGQRDDSEAEQEDTQTTQTCHIQEPGRAPTRTIQ